ncbi:MAG: Ig-like domain-containing protein [Candidatus Shapirobacteria bacterium]
MRNKYILIIIFLSLSLIASLFLVLRTTIFFGKATSSNNSPIALENSYIFASPLQAKADGKEQIRVTVYLLDGRGLGVANKNVILNIPNSIKTNDLQSTSDDSGKAVFDLASIIPQKTIVTATADNKQLPQKINVVFY